MSAPDNCIRGIERDGNSASKVVRNDPPHYVDHAHGQSRGAWFILGNDQGPGPGHEETGARMRRGTGESASRFSGDGWTTPSGIAMRSNFRFDIAAMHGSGDLPINY
jgi:hypothetical protein